MTALLAALSNYPDVDVHRLRALPEWQDARSWGWVMESGELTGTGLRHAGEIPKGILPDHL